MSFCGCVGCVGCAGGVSGAFDVVGGVSDRGGVIGRCGLGLFSVFCVFFLIE